MSKISFCETEDKSKILDTLLEFDKDKTKGFNEKKYKYAGELSSCKKSDLEIAKADAEYSVGNDRAFAALLAAIGVFLQWYIPWKTEYFSHYIEPIFRLLVFAPSAFILIRAAQRGTWLHVIKIAIALKSESGSANSPSTAPK